MDHSSAAAHPAPDTVVFHPSMAQAYRERVSRLIRTLGSAEGM
ncbi:hypothetical protein [Leisingera daeponensis]|nr:hypothetical protein [Leisingera daeponensis]